MKRIQYHQYGGPETMQLEEFKLEEPGNGQVAVQVKFAAINPIDWKLRNGLMKIVTGRRFPRAMGMDFSGTVISVGRGVTRFKPGDPVFGMARLKQCGAFGHAVITNESFLVRKPDNVSFEDAACLATPGVMAWIGLVDQAGLQPGQRVFVSGCAGAVGEATVQVARMLGASVSGSCSAGDIERVRALGVEHVYDYRETDFAKLGERFHVVYDAAATLPTAVGMSLLREGGMLLDLNPMPTKFIRALLSRRFKVLLCSANADNLEQVAHAASEGRLRLPIGKRVHLNDAIRLIGDVEAGKKIGGKGLIAME
jgi:NADPH:quinone reductase-like Zn-dependent oxidoreductase